MADNEKRCYSNYVPATAPFFSSAVPEDLLNIRWWVALSEKKPASVELLWVVPLVVYLYDLI